MARTGKPRRTGSISAQVWLRSVSGRSLREFAAGSPPADLAPFRAKTADVDAADRHFRSLGFAVYRDELGLTLTIEAPATLFAKVFGKSALSQESLPAPPELEAIVERILVTPKPEYFGDRQS